MPFALAAPLPPHDAEGTPDNVGSPGTPASLTFLSRLYHDAGLLALPRSTGR